MLESHAALLIMLFQYAPYALVLTILSLWAVGLTEDRRNKNEWDVRDKYLEYQMLKRYPLSRAKITVNLHETSGPKN